jgi:hypothetical protein
MKNITSICIYICLLFSSINSYAETKNKPYGLQFVEMYANEVLAKNYAKQLKQRIFELYPTYKTQDQDVEKWLTALFSSGQFNVLLALNYKKLFTEAEFKELLKFYQSDIGKKFMKVAPKMSAMSADVAGKMVQNKFTELKRYLDKEKNKAAQ